MSLSVKLIIFAGAFCFGLGMEMLFAYLFSLAVIKESLYICLNENNLILK